MQQPHTSILVSKIDGSALVGRAADLTHLDSAIVQSAAAKCKTLRFGGGEGTADAMGVWRR